MIRRVVPAILLFTVVGCAQDTAESPDDPLDDQSDSTDISVVPAEMPSYPLAQPGQLAVTTSHREEHYVLVDQAWDAWVGKCSESGIVQVIAKTDGYGIAVLLMPAGEDPGSMTLPIVISNDSTPPDSSARVALQIYPEDRAYVLKGVDGTLEIDSVTEFVSGRFCNPSRGINVSRHGVRGRVFHIATN